MFSKVEVDCTADVLIFGGGVAGLWILDELVRAGREAILVETDALGGGQTVRSQGIIHGGLKYTLGGLMNPSAEAIREMPGVWRACLRGEREPRLTGTRVRSECCYLWHTESLKSRVGMIGARVGLRVAPAALDRDERPGALRDCPGTVARLDEQVIDCVSLLEDLSRRHEGRIVRTPAGGIGLETVQPGAVARVVLSPGDGSKSVRIGARHIVFAAGAGNGALRRIAELSEERMQIRPLHMVMARGDPARLPELHGHCVDGAKTRVTITSAEDSAGRRVWQIGGQIAEDGVEMDAPVVIARAKAELRAVLPGVSLHGVEWSTYSADRAEAAAGGKRPDDATVVREGNTITAWPTKLALAPRLAALVLREVDGSVGAAGSGGAIEKLATWPRPAVALPPWEEPREWLG